MKLNIYNNFRAFYYNSLVNFYLYFNTLVPYYDDVILSLSITSFKNIINNSSISLKTINQHRMMQLLYSLNDKDKIVVDDDGFVFIDYENKNEIIKDVATDTGADDQDTDTEEPTNNPVVYTEDIIIETTANICDIAATADIAATTDTNIEDDTNGADSADTAPVVYTQDIVIDDTDDTDDTDCHNSLDKKNN
jgi:hypothetical protein